MTHPIRNRSRLLLGCGSTALALALTLAPQAAQAQAINATGNVVSGSASIDTMVPGQTTVDVASPTAVIDWTPAEDAGGNALGQVKAVLNHGAGDVLEILGPGMKQPLLLPFTKAVVPTVDLAAGRMVVDLPEEI